MVEFDDDEGLAYPTHSRIPPARRHKGKPMAITASDLKGFVALALGICLFCLEVVCINVPSAPREPLPGALFGSTDALVRTYEEVFSEELLEQLIKEAPELDKVGRSRLLKNSKRQTFWMPMGHGAPKARFAIEHAVNLLLTYYTQTRMKLTRTRCANDESKSSVASTGTISTRRRGCDLSLRQGRGAGLTT